jgi:hypothetical protein
MAIRTSASRPRAAAKSPARPTPKAAAKPAAKKTAPVPAKPVVVKAPPPAPAPKAAAPAKPPKLKAKLVRDSFTMPQSDFALIAVLKERALGFKRPTKKSELLRAGLQALAGLNNTSLQAALNALAPLKPGRPKKTD